MALQAAVVLAPAELLNVQLRRWVVDYFSDDAHALDEGLADPRVVAALVKQDTVELQARPFLGVAVVHRDEVAFANSILARTVFKDCIHHSISIQPVGIKTITLALRCSRGQRAMQIPG